MKSIANGLAFLRMKNDIQYLTEFRDIMTDMLNEKGLENAKPISERRCDKHYHELLQLRNYIYLNPNDTFDSDKVHAQFHGSAGHLRAIYKKCFGVSFHQDCINARIAKARYYIAIKQFTTNQTADVCGFSENKYFMRQFLSETGMTANQYRCIITFEN